MPAQVPSGAKAEAMHPLGETLMWPRAGMGSIASQTTILDMDQGGEGTAALTKCCMVTAQDTCRKVMGQQQMTMTMINMLNKMATKGDPGGGEDGVHRVVSGQACGTGSRGSIWLVPGGGWQALPSHPGPERDQGMVLRGCAGLTGGWLLSRATPQLRFRCVWQVCPEAGWAGVVAEVPH